MKKYHSNIKLPVSFVPYENRSFDIFREIPITKELINKEFIDWLESIGITFDRGRFFNSPPLERYKLHVDDLRFLATDHHVKLNIVFDSTDTEMNWYEPLPGYFGDKEYNVCGENILYYDKNKCKVLHTTSVNTHCILQTNIVHDLVNGTNNGQYRKCYSLVLLNSKTNKKLTWEESVEILGSYLFD
jgi:hypothetical protein